MFESVELGEAITKQESEIREPEICAQLQELQRELRDAVIAPLFFVTGVGNAGNGEVVNCLDK